MDILLGWRCHRDICNTSLCGIFYIHLMVISCAVWSLRHMSANNGMITVLTSREFHDSRHQHFHSPRQEQLASTNSAIVCTLEPKHAGLWYIFHLYVMSDWLTDWMADEHIGRTLWAIIKKRCDSLQAYYKSNRIGLIPIEGTELSHVDWCSYLAVVHHSSFLKYAGLSLCSWIQWLEGLFLRCLGINEPLRYSENSKPSQG